MEFIMNKKLKQLEEEMNVLIKTASKEELKEASQAIENYLGKSKEELLSLNNKK